ncbi:transposase [Methanothermococcus sp.]|jgi:putative transposase|uniref:RNA-guided endonuclease InsQ/TnpB family protein n=1 Tax=Methanothermococcus sp. TaxID=2614238 RepID=UPI002589BDDC|nr:transposase [Methanothermococcus sp.]
MQVARVLTINLTRSLNKEQLTIINHLTYSASKLWNVSNYEVIQRDINPNKIDTQMKNNFWFKNLHSQSAQAVCQKLTIAWNNFFKQHTKRPRYQPKDGHYPVKWKKQGFKIVGNKLRLSLSKQTKNYLKGKYGIKSKYLWVRLPKALPLDVINGLKEIEIVPQTIYGITYYILHLIYKKAVIPSPAKENNILSIDLGIKNLATAVTNTGRAVIYDGKRLISKFRWFAKTKGGLQSELRRSGELQNPKDFVQSTLTKQELKNNKRLSRLTVKEKSYTKDYLHKVSKMIVDFAVENETSKIIIGELNKGISNINIGRKNNEKLHRIPFGRLVSMIMYKAEEKGITVEQVNEAYTSQTCSNCGVVKKSNRKFRGLYVCSNCGTVLNADINSALNILKKVYGVALNLLNGDRGSGLGHPCRVSPY